MPDDAGSPIVEVFVDGLWRRVRDVLLVAERIDTFAFGADAGPARLAFERSEAETLGTEAVLRALRAAGDRVGWTIISTAATDDTGADLGDLAGRLGMPRVAVAERVNELVQAGLAVRALDADRVVLTAAGLEIGALVRATADGLAERILRARSSGEERAGDGLPLL